MTGIPTFTATDAIEDISSALADAGCAVIRDAASQAAIDGIIAELQPAMTATPVAEDDDPQAFYPARTRRITALMARSPGSHALALNPQIAGLCERHLGPNCERYHLHVSAALEVGPGAREQVLHREEDPFDFFPVPRPNLILASMWAMSDFRADNGATLLVPGSHRWEADRQATPAETLAAEMPKGSVMIWLGGTLHAAGANVSNDWRYGIILSYSLGWLRQEENQYLDAPEDIAGDFSEDMKALLGYPMHGSLGFYDSTLRASLTAS